AARLAKEQGLPGWRQHGHWLHKVKKLVRDIGRASGAKSKDGPARLQTGYKELLHLAEELLQRGRQLAALLQAAENLSVLDVSGIAGATELLHYADLTA